jgi:HEAT repeat protein
MPGFLALILASAAVFAVLAGMVVATKQARDRSERRLDRERRRVRVALRAGDDVALAHVLGRADARGPALDALILEVEAAVHVEATRHALRHAGAGRAAVLSARLAGSRRPRARARGALLAGAVPFDRAEEVLAPLLHDPDRDVAVSAIRSLSRIATPPAIEALVECLTDGRVRHEQVVDALATPSAFESLGRALTDPRHATDRPWLIEALGPAGGARATPVLARILASGPVEERIRAARSLGRGGDREAEPVLLDAMSDPEWPVRAQAATALGTLHLLSERDFAAFTALDMSVLDALADALDDRAWWVRANAAAALIDAGSAGRLRLTAALQSRDPFARERAREALDLRGLGAAGVAVAT